MYSRNLNCNRIMRRLIIIIVIAILALPVTSCKKNRNPISATPKPTSLILNAFGVGSECFPPSKFYCDIEVWSYDQNTGDVTKSAQYTKLNLTETAFVKNPPGGSTLELKNFNLPKTGQFILKVRFESDICGDCCQDKCNNPPRQGRPIYTYNTPFMEARETVGIDLKRSSCRCC